jgi:chemotaxis signal transduction protein
MTGELPDLIFMRVGAKRFAFPAEIAREVLPLVDASPMPGWPAHALGAIDVRSELMPLLDVSAGLGLPPLELRPSQRIVVVNAGGRSCGVVVDEVEAVRPGQVDASATVAIPAVEVRPPSCLGVTLMDGETIVVFGVDDLFSALPELEARG